MCWGQLRTSPGFRLSAVWYRKGMSRSCSDSLMEALGLAEDDPAFAIVREGRFDSSRPLIVWVHPGDACESDHPEQSVRLASWELQEGMGREVAARLPEHDVAVLHRLSSAYALGKPRRVAEPYRVALAESHRRPETAVLYGDDLDAASAWLLTHWRAADRPRVWLTGAYADPRHGCLTAVGQALAAAGAYIEVSPYSPCEAGSTRGAWRPRRRTRLSR